MDLTIVQACAEQFPSFRHANSEGLLCGGGDLRPERLVAAYSRGIFPWYSDDSPILWWSPPERCILPLEKFHLPSRSARTLRKLAYDLSCDQAFCQVIRACAMPREYDEGTWITDDMIVAYERLHQLGYAHSIETWENGDLVGGLYGVGLGKAFFGESMFHTKDEASRAALAGLVKLLRQRGVVLLDCQQETPHMMRMGAEMVSRADFTRMLRKALSAKTARGNAKPHDVSALDLTGWGASYEYCKASASWVEQGEQANGGLMPHQPHCEMTGA